VILTCRARYFWITLPSVKRKWLALVVGLLFLDGLLGGRWWYYRHENRFDTEILTAARRYQVAPALVKAVVWRESWFNPYARGRAQECGLMQLQEAAGRDWADAEKVGGFALDQLFDPAINTRVGAWYLRKLLRRYEQTDNPLPYALADYNAGRTHVRQWMQGPSATNSAAFMEHIGFPGTRKYVRAVLERYAYYQTRFPRR